MGCRVSRCLPVFQWWCYFFAEWRRCCCKRRATIIRQILPTLHRAVPGKSNFGRRKDPYTMFNAAVPIGGSTHPQAFERVYHTHLRSRAHFRGGGGSSEEHCKFYFCNETKRKALAVSRDGLRFCRIRFQSRQSAPSIFMEANFLECHQTTTTGSRSPSHPLSPLSDCFVPVLSHSLVQRCGQSRWLDLSDVRRALGSNGR